MKKCFKKSGGLAQVEPEHASSIETDDRRQHPVSHIIYTKRKE